MSRINLWYWHPYFITKGSFKYSKIGQPKLLPSNELHCQKELWRKAAAQGLKGQLVQKSFASKREDQKELASLRPIINTSSVPPPAQPLPGFMALEETGQGNAFLGLTLGREQASTRREGVDGIMKPAGVGVQ